MALGNSPTPLEIQAAVKALEAPATASAAGLMSAADKTKLDGVATGATAVTVVDNLTSTSTTSALSAAQGKALGDSKLDNTALGAANGAASLDASGKVTAAQTASAIVSVTANKTLALSDNGTLQQVNSTSARTVTVPTNASVAFPVGAEIEILRYNTGTVTISAASGVTIRSADNKLAIGIRYAVAALKKLGTNEWLLTGYLS